MQWLLLFCLFVLAGHCVESAVPYPPCPPGQKYRGSKCIPEEDAVPKKFEPLSGKECAPGSTWRSQCNTCRCNDNGMAVCTRALCVGDERDPIMSCAPDTTWKNVCNTCWCRGGKPMCTKMECVSITDFADEEKNSGTKPITNPKLREVKKECKPDEVFELDCNMCRCNPDGKSFSCTRRACVEEDKKKESLSRHVRDLQQAELRKACQPGQEFRMDCNKCLCDNEGQIFSCTRIDCNALNNNHDARKKREVTKQEIKKCVPGSVFNQGCNVCRCTDEGLHATCTLKRCHQDNEVDVQSPEQDPGFRCNAGEQFTRDCNDCTCSADGKSVFCTIRLCDEQLTPDII